MKIAVTGLNNVDNPGPGVPVIRGIKDAKDFKCEIIGLIYDALEPAPYMDDIVKSTYTIPYPSGGLDLLFERIKYIHSKEKLDVIVPTLDSELFGFTKLTPKLDELGIKTFLPSTEQLILRGKDKLASFCNDNDILVPKNILATSAQDIYKVSSEFKFPVAVKGIFYDAKIANNLDEVFSAFKSISSKWGFPVVIQEYIKGEEYNVSALGDGEGKTIGAVAMKKLYITDNGKGWSGVTIYDNKLIELSKNIISKIKWKSGAELEFIKEEKTNKYYLLEMNPRFPAWVYLSVASGQNLPYSLVELALGKKVEPFEKYEVGKLFIRYSWDLITDLKQFENISVNGEMHNG
ncbi:MAG: biotin carboxylase [Ignavibacteriales bacterium CG12_big_fil_rev_8_21_14_0_65_30_8]|nr:MAG: biotin carboxylase [Ignavibacteriales bacterium CG12_big_fil_rev_8_21_14_0_65_30_8]